MKRKAIALLRVSSEAQAGPDRQGLPAQRRAVHRIAEAHDLEIVEEVEIQVSGARVLEDQRFQRLLERIDGPTVHGVVVVDLDRLMRPEDPTYYSIFRRFRDTGTVIYTSAGPKDFRTDRLLMVIESEIAALERERIAERTRRGREEKRRQGKRAEGLGLPRGVDFDHKTGEWSYVWPDAERVRDVFRLWLESHGTLSFREIARRTNLVPPTYREPSGAVSRILRQPLYAGIYRVDRRWRDGKAAQREPHETYEHRVLDPPLVTVEEFQRAQELLARKRARRAPRRSHDAQGATYAGHLDCSLCGASVWVQRDSRGYPGYVCGNARVRKCRTGQTSVGLADPQIDAALDTRLGDIDTLRRLIERSVEEAQKRAQAPPGELARKLSHLHNQRERVKDAYEEGIYDLRDLQKRLAKIDGEVSVLEGLLEHEEEPIAVDPELVAELVDVFSSWRHLRREEKREILRAYQIRVRVSRPARRIVSVDQVVIGSLNNLAIFKKLRRHGMQ